MRALAAWWSWLTGSAAAFHSSAIRRAAPDEGFTLVEVLVAFVIAAGALGVAFQLFSKSLDGTGRLEAYTRAVQLAQSQLELAGVGEALIPGTSSGRFDERFAWQMTADRFEPSSTSKRPGALTLYQVQVTVFWRQGGASGSVSLTSLRPAPSQEKPA
jgi:general secretion pathway protein I